MDVRTEALVSFSPAMLDFGRCTAGAARSLPLLLTIDKRLATTSAGIPFELVCSSPGIKISPRDGAVSAQPAGAEIKAYTLTLTPDANLGLLTGVVSLMVPTPPGAANAAPAGARERIAALLAATSVALHGEVVGSVSASPAAVVFGVVNAGQSVPRRFALNGSSAEALANLKI